MQKHTKLYFKYFNIAYNEIGWHDPIPCEVEGCHRKSVDIHHIHGRGKGKDVIENLMGLCRTHHEGGDDLSPPRDGLLSLRRARPAHDAIDL